MVHLAGMGAGGHVGRAAYTAGDHRLVARLGSSGPSMQYAMKVWFAEFRLPRMASGVRPAAITWWLVAVVAILPVMGLAAGDPERGRELLLSKA
ncbi:MAG: hypothetical protein EBU59_08780, partial [Planctomycetia bacterium]|nr:hypothetical protein [Planctomycetia bacterium]